MAIAGTTLTFAITVSNAGPSVSQNVILSDTIPSCVLNPEYSIDQVNYNPWIGSINLGSIGVNVATIVYIRGLINPSCSGFLINTAIVDSPTPDPDPKNNTSTVTVPIISSEGITISKIVDKVFVEVGNSLTYTVVITNIGNVTIDNAIFSDTIPAGTAYDNNQPVLNINLGSIQPEESKTVTFSVKVVSKPCPPEIINIAAITGTVSLITQDFISPRALEQKTLYMESNQVLTYVNPKAFKQFSIDTSVKIPPQKPEAEDILDSTSIVEIIYSRVIKTPIITSYEGQILTGWKLIIEGVISQKITYIADEPTQSIHAAEFEIPFSTFIILPKDYTPCMKLRVGGIIESDCQKLLSDKRTISQCIILMINAKYRC